MKLRILISFHYYRGTDLDEMCAAFPEPPEIFADSGGFSAYSQGAEVSADEYIAWLHRWKHRIATYANLDSIGDAEATVANQRILEAADLHPIPVFHAGEPMSFLADYLDAYPYIALGGMVPLDADLALRWAAQCFKAAEGRDVRFHGFGQTSVKVMRSLPWYSMDSSSWGGAHRYGRLHLWDDNQARFLDVKLGSHGEVYRHAALIRQHGGDPAKLGSAGFGKKKGTDKSMEQGRAERAAVIAVNVAAWLRMEAWLRRHHGTIPAPRNAERDGPRVYLADTNLATNSTETDAFDRTDLVQAARNVGPKVYLAESRGTAAVNDQATAAHDLTGVRLYLAEGSQENLEMAAQAAQEIGAAQ